MKPVRPSTLLVAALSATVVELEGMAGIGDGPAPFQVVTLMAAVIAAGMLVWMGRPETKTINKFLPVNSVHRAQRALVQLDQKPIVYSKVLPSRLRASRVAFGEACE